MTKIKDNMEDIERERINTAEQEREYFPKQKKLNNCDKHTSNKEKYIATYEMSNEELDEIAPVI